MIADYLIVKRGTAELVQEEVKEWIQLSWEPFGSIMIDKNGFVYQPMVRYEDKNG